MPADRFQRQLVRSLVGVTLLATVACERTSPAVKVDSVAHAKDSTRADGRVATDDSGWNTDAGPVLLVQGEERGEAIVLLPREGLADGDAEFRRLALQSPHVSLFGRGGAQLSGVLADSTAETDAECRVRPLRNVAGEGNTAAWAVGFVSDGKVTPLALDSIDALSARDSMALVAEASRLASAVTAVTSPSFQGLRFTVHDVRRFEVAPGMQALVAHLIRKVNQEANPLEEQTLLIAERDSGVTTGPYQLAFAERMHGLEEQSTTPEVIAAVRIAGRPTLLVARDSDAGVAYVMIERVGPRQWHLRWTSALTRCG